MLNIGMAAQYGLSPIAPYGPTGCSFLTASYDKIVFPQVTALLALNNGTSDLI
jgi:hypothetical protein